MYQNFSKIFVQNDKIKKILKIFKNLLTTFSVRDIIHSERTKGNKK